MLRSLPPPSRPFPPSPPTQANGVTPERYFDVNPKQKSFLEETQSYHGRVFNNLPHQYVLMANRQIKDRAEMTGAEAKLENSKLLEAFQKSIGPDGKGMIPLARWCIARDAGNDKTKPSA
jgi:hypothetical protein